MKRVIHNYSWDEPEQMSKHYDMQDRTCIVAITFEQSDRKANIIYMQYNLLITDTIGFVSKPFVEAIREKHDENVISKS
jgi:hypothetical protein